MAAGEQRLHAQALWLPGVGDMGLLEKGTLPVSGLVILPTLPMVDFFTWAKLK